VLKFKRKFRRLKVNIYIYIYIVPLLSTYVYNVASSSNKKNRRTEEDLLISTAILKIISFTDRRKRGSQKREKG
jgi:hypothetical protein